MHDPCRIAEKVSVPDGDFPTQVARPARASAPPQPPELTLGS